MSAKFTIPLTLDIAGRSASPERRGFLWLTWMDGCPPDEVKNTAPDRSISISVEQWFVLVSLIQRHRPDNQGTNCANDPSSWLAGFETGLRASAARLEADREAQQPSPAQEGTGPVRDDRSGSQGNRPVHPGESRSSRHQDRTSSNSSSGQAGEERAAESQPPSRIRIVLHGVSAVEAADGEMTVECLGAEFPPSAWDDA